MIEAINTGPIAEPRRNVREQTDTQPVFSFALAAASLEGRAGAALKAFGGEPDGGAVTNIETSTQGAQRGRQEQSLRQPAPTNTAKTPENAATQTSPQTNAASPAGVAPAALVANAPPPTSVAVNASPAAPVIANLSAPRGESQATAIREVAVRGAAAAARAPVVTAPRAHVDHEGFARLMARRLEAGSTAFDLRLDPPGLGKVEARLVVGDDGKTVLALKFDNQAALDLFARDEAALRAALAGAGFDLAGGDLAFSLASGGRDEAATIAPSPFIAATTADTYEPRFIAPFSEGVIDLRV